MRRPLLLASLMMLALTAFGQSAPRDVAADYDELADTKPHDGPEVWDRMSRPAALAWGTTDVRYKKFDLPEGTSTRTLRLRAWRGERVHAQAVLWTRSGLDSVRLSVGSLRAGRAVIPDSAVSASFVRYVMTDEPNPDGSGCGLRPVKSEWDSSLVADVIDIARVRPVGARSAQPLWLTVRVPRDARPGRYSGTLDVTAARGERLSLPFEVEVSSRTLTPPSEWKLNLDLWQNPYAVARYYGVPLWSQAHFDAMRPIMKMLADAGQRAITTTLMYEPWGGQTEDFYLSMITRTRRLDGTWAYDYAVFDRWVEFMTDDVGIGGLINCYSLIPWSLSFDYFDQATNRVEFITARPGDKAYADYWVPFLKDFAAHLRRKGWFERTAIAMDERPMEAMREAIKVIKAADPAFKISLAGGYHPEIIDDLYYLSVPYGVQFPDSVKAGRRSRGQLSCVYTCCTEAFPNIFTFSDPAEAAWTAIHAVAGDYDGYLRWAVNSWTADPLRDSRFTRFAAGDTYNIYPGPRSSIRFERLVEGLQAAEKVRLLREDLAARGERRKLDRLNHAVGQFTPAGMEAGKQTAGQMVSRLHELLNTL